MAGDAIRESRKAPCFEAWRAPMTNAEHEARIDRWQFAMLEAADTKERRIAGWAFMQSVLARNAERTPEQLREIERARGLA